MKYRWLHWAICAATAAAAAANVQEQIVALWRSGTTVQADLDNIERGDTETTLERGESQLTRLLTLTSAADDDDDESWALVVVVVDEHGDTARKDTGGLLLLVVRPNDKE